jgi:hypothetical protein
MYRIEAKDGKDERERLRPFILNILAVILFIL